MGIENRDYYQGPDQDPQSNYSFGGPGRSFGGQGRLLVTNLVIINAIVYLFEILFDQANSYQFTYQYLALDSGLFVTNWKLWQIITYGFAHDPEHIFHILGNMFCLWFFGRDVEGIYGKQRFLSFYLSAIAISGVLGLYAQQLLKGGQITLLGASGGVAGVIILYICHFPHRTLMLYFVIPVRAWVLGVLFLLYDFVGTFSDSHIAHGAHLVGAACGWIYYRTGWDLSRWLPSRERLNRRRRQPKVRIHDPDSESLGQEVDRLLAKIGREGEASLTRKERKTLERASARYKNRNR
jgi:membrane associated rhomboid family serine protease